MKKALSLVLALVMIVAAFAVFTVSASADDEYEFKDGVLTLKNDIEHGFSTSKYNPKDEYPWKEVRAQITKVVAAEGVTKIGHHALYGCTALKEVELSKTVTEIQKFAFAKCTALETITFKAPLQTAGENLVQDCTALATITLQDQSKALFFEVLNQGDGNTAAGSPFANATYVELGNTKPTPPDEPAILSLSPYYGNIENWPSTSDTSLQEYFFGEPYLGNDKPEYQYKDYVKDEKTYRGSRTLFIVGGTNEKLTNKLKGGEDAMAFLRVIVTDETTGKIYKIEKYAFDYSIGREIYGDGSFLRLSLCDYGVPVSNEHTYTVSCEFYYDDGELSFVWARGTSEKGAFHKGSNQLFVDNGAIVTDPVPHTCEEIEKDTIAEAIGKMPVVVSPYETGMENWGGSDKVSEEMPKVTQILFFVTPWNGDYYKEGFEVTVNMKANDDSSDDTFTTKVTSRWADGGLLRIEPCLMDTPWIPVKNKEYTATFTFVDKDGDLVTVTATDDDGEVAIYKITEEPYVIGGVVTPKIDKDYNGTFKGKNGEDLTWAIDAATKTLTIGGTGEMADFGSNKDTPWYEYAEELEALVVKGTVTTVGKNTASNSNIKTATFEEGVKVLGFDACAYCDSLKTVNLPISLEEVKQGSVYGSNSIETVNYPGTTEQFMALPFGPYNDLLKSKLVAAGDPPVVEIPTSGEFENAETGDKFSWTLTDGTLTIDGKGEMPDFADQYVTPWNKSIDDIKALVVKGGVTKVGKNTASHTAIETATFEEGVAVLGFDCIAYCGSLKTVNLPKTLAEIKQGIVWGSGAIEAVNYPGTAEEFAAIPKGMYNDKLTEKLVPGAVTPPAEPVKLGGYSVAAGMGIKLEDNKYVIGYDFDLTGEEWADILAADPEIVPKTMGDNNGTYTFVLTLKNGDKVQTKTVTVSSINDFDNWSPNDYGLYFGLDEFEVAYGESYDLKIEITTPGGKQYYVEEAGIPCQVKAFQADGGSFTNPETEDEFTWTLTADGTLTIDGSGEMPDFKEKSDRPWNAYSDGIKKLVVKGGVAVVGKNTASGTGIEEATFEEGVCVIGFDCIAYCGNLKVVNLPKTLAEIKQGTVYGSNNIETVNYPGTTDEFKALPKGNYNDNLLKNLVAAGDVSVEIPTSGEFTNEATGDKFTWKIEDGTLTIDGSGEMPDFADSSDQPWFKSADDIKTLIVKGGVKKVGKNTASHTAVETAYFCEGVEVLGNDALGYNDGLKEVYLPKSLTEIKQGVVYGSKNIEKVNYAGTEEQFEEIPKGAYNDNFANGFTENVKVPTGSNVTILVVLAILAVLGTAVVVSKKVFSK